MMDQQKFLQHNDTLRSKTATAFCKIYDLFPHVSCIHKISLCKHEFELMSAGLRSRGNVDFTQTENEQRTVMLARIATKRELS